MLGSRGLHCPGEGLALRSCSSQMKLECEAALFLQSPQLKRQLTSSVFIVMSFYGKSCNHNEAKASTVTPALHSVTVLPLYFPMF